MNELALKLTQAHHAHKVLRMVLSDRPLDVQLAALSLGIVKLSASLELPDKIALMHRLTAEIFGPESVESQLDRYIQELKDAKKSEEKAAPPSSGTV